MLSFFFDLHLLGLVSGCFFPFQVTKREQPERVRVHVSSWGVFCLLEHASMCVHVQMPLATAGAEEVPARGGCGRAGAGL